MALPRKRMPGTPRAGLTPKRQALFENHVRSSTAAALRVDAKYKGRTANYLIGMDPGSKQPVVINTATFRVVGGLEKSAVMSAFFKKIPKK